MIYGVVCVFYGLPSSKCLYFMRKYIHTVLFLVASLTMYSCDDCPAEQLSNYELSVRMYYLDSLLSTGEKVVYQDSFISIGAIDLDTTIFENSQSGDWLLPLYGQTDRVTFQWTDSNSVRSLEVLYKVSLVPVPPDCGVYEVYENVSIGAHTFDSVSLVKSTLEIGDDLHIEIFANP